MSDHEFRQFLVPQAQTSTFAEDSVVNAAAMFLGEHILFISYQNKAEAPYTRIPSGQSVEAPTIIGYLPGVHFQSMYPYSGQ